MKHVAAIACLVTAIAAAFALAATSPRTADDEAAARLESLTSALNSLPMVIFFKDTEGVYRGGNTAWAALLGKPLPELLSGKTDFDLFPEEVAKSFRAYDAAMLASGKAVRNQETLVYPDGRSVLVETLKAPWIGSDGKPRGLVGICVELAAPAAPKTP